MKKCLAFAAASFAATTCLTFASGTPARAQAGEPRTEAEIDSEIRRLEVRRRELRLEAARRALEAAERELAEAQSGARPVQMAGTAGTPSTPTPVTEGAGTGEQESGEEEQEQEQEEQQEEPEPKAEEGSQNGGNHSAKSLVDSPTDRHTFGGIDFGIGVAFSYDLGGERRVRQTELVNGLVRVTQADNARARMILESHYLFTPEGRWLFGRDNYCADGRVLVSRERHQYTRRTGGEISPPGNVDDVTDRPAGRTYVSCTPQLNWGFGPFIALQPGSDAIIDAVGAGLMVGFRRAGDRNQSFNFGIGMLYDVDVRVLGPGITANQPLPPGETSVRYQQREQAALLLLSSFSF